MMRFESLTIRVKFPTVGLLFVAAGCALMPARLAVGADDDSVARAMRDELARSMGELKMDQYPPPYYVAYTYEELQRFSCSASFGALSGSGFSHDWRVAVDARVGDYELDNTNFVRNYSLTGGAARLAAPEAPDYWNIRHRLWVATDLMYKRAIEDFAAKTAWLQRNNVPDRPADLSRADPSTHIEEQRALAIESAKFEELVKRLSARFRTAAAIQSSDVYFEGTAANSTLVNSEGSHVRQGATSARLTVVAGTQAADGMPLGDTLAFYGVTPEDLPDEPTLIAAVDELIARLTARVSGPRAEEYIGPVLLEGDAACFAMLELLIDRLSSPDEPLGYAGLGTPFKNRLKKRVTPAFLSITDDPTVTRFADIRLLGAYAVDDDGVPAQPVTLVDEGRLKEWYMSRVPTRAIKPSNGHSRSGKGGPGCVLVKSSNTLGREQLRAELIKIAVEQELPYAIRIESIARADVGVRGATAGGGFRDGTVELSAPISAYRVYQDGHEEPIRGGEWQGVTLRTLRDIFVTGDQPHVLNVIRRGSPVSVVCPALLIEEMEMKKPEEQEARLPYLTHPSFEQP